MRSPVSVLGLREGDLKKILCILLMAGMLAVLVTGCGTQKTATKDSTGKTYTPTFHAPAAQNGLIFNSPELQFQLLRTMGATAYGAADIGECLESAMQVDEAQLAQGNFDSWYNAWNSTAGRLRSVADQSLAAGDKTSARDTYLRCNTYYNNAQFYLHGNPKDPRISQASSSAVACFNEAGKLMDPPVEQVSIKYENTTLPGYFYRVDTSNKKRPLLIIQTGYDGTQQELYSECGLAGLQRGYNVLTFEGPGQGEVLWKQGLHFRPDWEKVVTPVVDYAVSRKDVDSGKMTLWGVSMGGYLAARAAAYEHRLKALILDPAMDMAQVVVREFGPEVAGISGNPNFKPDVQSMRAAIQQNPNSMAEGMIIAMKGNIGITWFFQNGIYTFGVDGLSSLPLKMLDYSLAGVTGKITANTLVCDSEQDVEKYGSMTRDIYNDLKCPKKYILFTNAEGAGAHCEMGANRFADQNKLDWLNGVIGI
jgi:pimeloyl-ACP methyl ester carboxylesterase